MDRLIPTLIIVAVIIGLFALMWWGWTGRQRRQSAIPAPEAPAADLRLSSPPIAGTYVATTLAAEPLERVAVHHLGVRTTASLGISGTGIVLDRDGVPDILIPAAALEGVRTDSGMIGKFVERDGLIIVTWRLGDTLVDTGFRPRHSADRTPTLASIRQLLGEDS
ncbi:hypothetical protein [Brevibacterium otitidis]|uniref:PH domain-containing protein n=1 Tax=Brevibacterium otitidis TaxID=53364 RepID=A0ABV5X477_9MICO|nr:hypothetical protein GCM10023233_11530 [Brevibacterium otitidis]